MALRRAAELGPRQFMRGTAGTRARRPRLALVRNGLQRAGRPCSPLRPGRSAGCARGPDDGARRLLGMLGVADGPGYLASGTAAPTCDRAARTRSRRRSWSRLGAGGRDGRARPPGRIRRLGVGRGPHSDRRTAARHTGGRRHVTMIKEESDSAGPGWRRDQDTADPLVRPVDAGHRRPDGRRVRRRAGARGLARPAASG